MTREEAIARIKNHITIHQLQEPRAVRISEALSMAIKALEQSEPCEDAISRSDVIDFLCDWICGKDIRCNSSCKCINGIKAIPSVTPKCSEHQNGSVCEYYDLCRSTGRDAEKLKADILKSLLGCEDAVSRRAAIAAIENALDVDGFRDGLLTKHSAKSAINSIPTIMPKTKTGKWIKNDNGTWSCDKCNSWIPDEQHYYANWCLHCGAKMED